MTVQHLEKGFMGLLESFGLVVERGCRGVGWGGKLGVVKMVMGFGDLVMESDLKKEGREKLGKREEGLGDKEAER
ncbi:hypothetical protein PanWU01x14_264260 [Parasponia andersonii]|uniref:Uncharacterized protein n=1 Tax=Parasponia andersonii TaxID=3476 RepID=A0A2P5B7E7_PARAD|nr:hypothetical protein PanWU01x14_264260 [Parasponia andersonii]